MAGDVGFAKMAKVGVGQGMAQNAGTFALGEDGKQQAIEQHRAFACRQEMAILGHAEGTGGTLQGQAFPCRREMRAQTEVGDTESEP